MSPDTQALDQLLRRVLDERLHCVASIYKSESSLGFAEWYIVEITVSGDNLDTAQRASGRGRTPVLAYLDGIHTLMTGAQLPVLAP